MMSFHPQNRGSVNGRRTSFTLSLCVASDASENAKGIIPGFMKYSYTCNKDRMKMRQLIERSAARSDETK